MVSTLPPSGLARLSGLPHRVAWIETIAGFCFGPDAVQFCQDAERLRRAGWLAAWKWRMFFLPGLQETYEV
jgi:hypothetical protein